MEGFLWSGNGARTLLNSYVNGAGQCLLCDTYLGDTDLSQHFQSRCHPEFAIGEPDFGNLSQCHCGLFIPGGSKNMHLQTKQHRFYTLKNKMSSEPHFNVCQCGLVYHNLEKAAHEEGPAHRLNSRVNAEARCINFPFKVQNSPFMSFLRCYSNHHRTLGSQSGVMKRVLVQRALEDSGVVLSHQDSDVLYQNLVNSEDQKQVQNVLADLDRSLSSGTIKNAASTYPLVKVVRYFHNTYISLGNRSYIGAAPLQEQPSSSSHIRSQPQKPSPPQRIQNPQPLQPQGEAPLPQPMQVQPDFQRDSPPPAQPQPRPSPLKQPEPLAQPVPHQQLQLLLPLQPAADNVHRMEDHVPENYAQGQLRELPQHQRLPDRANGEEQEEIAEPDRVVQYEGIASDQGEPQGGQPLERPTQLTYVNGIISFRPVYEQPIWDITSRLDKAIQMVRDQNWMRSVRAQQLRQLSESLRQRYESYLRQVEEVNARFDAEITAACTRFRGLSQFQDKQQIVDKLLQRIKQHMQDLQRLAAERQAAEQLYINNYLTLLKMNIVEIQQKERRRLERSSRKKSKKKNSLGERSVPKLAKESSRKEEVGYVHQERQRKAQTPTGQKYEKQPQQRFEEQPVYSPTTQYHQKRGARVRGGVRRHPGSLSQDRTRKLSTSANPISIDVDESQTPPAKPSSKSETGRNQDVGTDSGAQSDPLENLTDADVDERIDVANKILKRAIHNSWFKNIPRLTSQEGQALYYTCVRGNPPNRVALWRQKHQHIYAYRSVQVPVKHQNYDIDLSLIPAQQSMVSLIRNYLAQINLKSKKRMTQLTILRGIFASNYQLAIIKHVNDGETERIIRKEERKKQNRKGGA